MCAAKSQEDVTCWHAAIRATAVAYKEANKAEVGKKPHREGEEG